MDKSNFDNFLQDVNSTASFASKFHQTLSPQYEQNVSKYDRKIAGVFKPLSRKDVLDILQLANKYKIPLYPISRGYNWAFGSKLPVKEHAVVLDLSQLNSISEYDADIGTVRVEPGVSQGQLSQFLTENKSRFFLDVTGSGFHTSIIGNSLERGIAYNSLRSDYILDLEVLLGTGEIIRTGFGAFPGPSPKNIYRYGLGPSLDQLFFQSNYGIVLAATYQLHPVPENKLALQIKFKTAHLSKVIDSFRELKQQGVLDCIVHAADPVRTATTLGPLLPPKDEAHLWSHIHKGEWSSIASIYGSSGIIREKLKIIKAKMGSSAQIVSFSEKKISFVKKIFSLLGMKSKVDFLNATSGLRGLVHGKPTNDALMAAFYRGNRDEYIASTDNSFRSPSNPDINIDKSPLGLLFCVPITSFRGESAIKIYKLVQDFSERTKILMGVTLNGMTEKLLEAVISLHFDESQKELAHKCLYEMYEELATQGIYPYRLNPDIMHFLNHRTESEKSIYKSLKQLFDPNNIIASGRYE